MRPRAVSRVAKNGIELLQQFGAQFFAIVHGLLELLIRVAAASLVSFRFRLCVSFPCCASRGLIGRPWLDWHWQQRRGFGPTPPGRPVASCCAFGGGSCRPLRAGGLHRRLAASALSEPAYARWTSRSRPPLAAAAASLVGIQAIRIDALHGDFPGVIRRLHHFARYGNQRFLIDVLHRRQIVGLLHLVHGIFVAGVCVVLGSGRFGDAHGIARFKEFERQIWHSKQQGRSDKPVGM